jgi:hypothetical protein
MTDTIKQVNDLSDELEVENKRLEKEPQDTALQVTDIFEQYKHLLTEKALKALEPEKKTTLYAFDAENGRKAYSRAIYLAGIARSPEGVDRAAKAFVGVLNDLAERGVLCGHLARLSTITLVENARFELSTLLFSRGTPATGIFSFPHVTLEWKVEGEAAKYEAEEAALPKVDFDPELAPKKVD